MIDSIFCDHLTTQNITGCTILLFYYIMVMLGFFILLSQFVLRLDVIQGTFLLY